ncbi:recombinase RecT [Nocardia sp. CA-128927]|uniref:recombinase RecT n=1 Tax=Nocardia sp. CA-128927 TaxID=3239975 RepID=UPI003D9603C2
MGSLHSRPGRRRGCLMSESITNAVDEAKFSAGALIQRHRADFAAVLPASFGIDRWLRLAESAVNASPDLLPVIRRDRGASMLRALMRCATLGHEPGGGLFHLVEKGGKVEGWEDYKGIMQRILRTGLYSKVVVEPVYEHDQYTFDANRDDRPQHVRAEGQRGKAVAAYAYAVHFGGAISTVADATPEIIQASKDKARGTDRANSPWNAPAAPMHRKVAIKLLEKYVSTAAEDRRTVGALPEALSTAPSSPVDLEPDWETA